MGASSGKAPGFARAEQLFRGSQLIVAGTWVDPVLERGRERLDLTDRDARSMLHRMSDEEEKEFSEGGSRICRHQPVERDWEVPDPDASVAQEVEEHLKRFDLIPESVFHEIVSDRIHLDVHICAPSESRPFYTLFTTGMADLPMTAPEGAENFARAELMICLPPTWPLDEDSLRDEIHYWPVQTLKSLARFPHEHETWLADGHTIPNGDPPMPFADDTGMCGAMLASPLTVPREAHRFDSSAGPVHIYSVLPLHEAEMNFKLERGADALLDRFDKDGVTEILDPARKPATRRRWFGLR